MLCLGSVRATLCALSGLAIAHSNHFPDEKKARSRTETALSRPGGGSQGLGKRPNPFSLIEICLGAAAF
jgi:hypothetical protein